MGKHRDTGKAGEPVTLKVLAAYLKLDPATVSVVLNNVPGRSIPEATRERIRAAAKKFNYQPSFVARSLRNRRTMTIGILVPVLADGYHTEVMSGIGDHLLEEDYFYFIAHHRHRPDLIEQYPRMLISRGAEGIIAIDTHLDHKLAVPAVAVAGHRRIPNVTNVVLDHNRAAELTMRHLYDLGHRSIAFMRGQPYSSDSEVRWQGIVKAARDLGIAIRQEMTIQLTEDLTSPELGYPVVQQLLAHHRRFTAIVCFNDMAAIGAIRALHDAQLRVPEDISVIGFDDIPQAAFQTPSLTTICQPLHEMGRLSAQLLLQKLSSSRTSPAEVAVKPQLIVRESTGPSRDAAKSSAKLRRLTTQA
ncbi:LacI family DNA-binding transcriptional regulator [Pseudacidobacterium ailaaui]|uniref:LacI family DNA-binding transcriptional regulator n=1 Tax=Pseudacidobacterium ailaaui TaxID=1382359 RepID=UPI00047B45AE|nr:LacI family DNA-binding transcriptional regulator [Pseudacidobacterium ailaaui]